MTKPVHEMQPLLECAQACDECVSDSLAETDLSRMQHCIRLAQDCGEICWMGVHLLSRGSELRADILRLCAEACDRCAEECRRHAHAMAHCRLCAEACGRCIEACRELAGNAVVTV